MKHLHNRRRAHDKFVPGCGFIHKVVYGGVLVWIGDRDGVTLWLCSTPSLRHTWTYTQTLPIVFSCVLPLLLPPTAGVEHMQKWITSLSSEAVTRLDELQSRPPAEVVNNVWFSISYNLKWFRQQQLQLPGRYNKAGTIQPLTKYIYDIHTSLTSSQWTVQVARRTTDLDSDESKTYLLR